MATLIREVVLALVIDGSFLLSMLVVGLAVSEYRHAQRIGVAAFVLGFCEFVFAIVYNASMPPGLTDQHVGGIGQAIADSGALPPVNIALYFASFALLIAGTIAWPTGAPVKAIDR
jgi:hypothetical protein